MKGPGNGAFVSPRERSVEPTFAQLLPWRSRQLAELGDQWVAYGSSQPPLITLTGWPSSHLSWMQTRLRGSSRRSSRPRGISKRRRGSTVPGRGVHKLDPPANQGIRRRDRVNAPHAHETIAGLNFCHAVAQALWVGKLFHIDLNSQRIGRFDQDLRFGQEGLKDAFLLVRLLEESGYDGARHFDAHALRVEDAAGVEDFARGCMRTYLILAEKARSFAADARVAEALQAAGMTDLGKPTVGAYTADAARSLAEEEFDVDALAARGYANERLDQLVIEHLLGI